jgi:hypothetical protein
MKIGKRRRGQNMINSEMITERNELERRGFGISLWGKNVCFERER